jgi:hypothetical protein
MATLAIARGRIDYVDHHDRDGILYTCASAGRGFALEDRSSIYLKGEVKEMTEDSAAWHGEIKKRAKSPRAPDLPPQEGPGATV